jgi:beta-phosphoglucomutase-like phosphatase (HAD superfamily)
MSKQEEQQVEGVSSKSALIFEMDNVALGARKIRYEVLAEIMKEQGIELTPVLFSRYCLHPSPAVYMPAFLEAMQYTMAPPEQVTERLMGETTSRLMQKDVHVHPGLVKWLDVAKERGAALACLSMFPQATAESIAAHMDFERWNVQVFSVSSSAKDFPHADGWLRMAKTLGRNPRRCLALVSSMAAAKSALAAMMNVVGVPDDFTEFQDFCGANLVCSDLSSIKPAEFFDEISF